MESQWIGHMLETDDGPLSCLIDIAHAENCPDQSRPLFTMVRIPFKNPAEHGFGEEDERNALGDIEDAIAEQGEQHGAVHVASVRGGGFLTILYYSPTDAQAPLTAIIKNACRGHQPQAGSFEDPDWEQYQDLFPPDEAIAHYNDLNLLSVLASHGDRHDRKRPVDHTLMLPSAAAADEAARKAALLGYQETERHEEAGEDLPVTLQLTREHDVQPETVTERRAELTEIAERLEGVYDGWATPVTE